MQGKKKNTGKYLAFVGIPFFVMFLTSVFAEDSIALTFSTQSATDSGSLNSIISTDVNLSYINKGNNSSIIGNYFSGYYYDSILGYFETDWSSNGIENVRIIGSTSQCSSGYGYKLGGYAYSPAFGFVDFDYNTSTFVYYCFDDEQLHGYTYSEHLGFQNFEGIAFDIHVASSLVPDIPTGTGAFVNDDTEITDEDPIGGGDDESPDQGHADDSNFTSNSIQNDIIEFDVRKESLFYIIK